MGVIDVRSRHAESLWTRCSAPARRVKKAAPGSAVFETVSEATFSGRVTERAGGKGVTATSGIVAYLDGEGLPGALTFGVRDLKVRDYQPCSAIPSGQQTSTFA